MSSVSESSMKIIDAHMHYSNVQAFHTAAEVAGVDYSRAGHRAECAAANVVGAVCMGLAESVPHGFPDIAQKTPMGADLDVSDAYISHIAGINPHTLNSASLYALRRDAKKGSIVGVKIYAGYYAVHIHDAKYDPVYRLAAECGLSVAIHTGDTYSETALLEFSHPLGADRLAVKYRDVNFVLCHMGDPWVMDACEVAYKNRNVFVDISGLLAGDKAHIRERTRAKHVMRHFKTGLQYLNDYKKVLFGTDWPLVPICEYVRFCKKLVPECAWADVFYENARRVYGLKVGTAPAQQHL